MTDSRPTALDEAVGICQAAAGAGITVRLAGGLAIQYLTPEFPPHGGDCQDLDLATRSSDRRPLTQFLAGHGYVGDKNFNALYGHKQLYFQSGQTGRSLDVHPHAVGGAHHQPELRAPDSGGSRYRHRDVRQLAPEQRTRNSNGQVPTVVRVRTARVGHPRLAEKGAQHVGSIGNHERTQR